MAAGRPTAAWLAPREPAESEFTPPASLAARVAELLGDAPCVDARDAAERCIAAAEGVVAGLLATQCTTRASALDLLSADALATYAFELASEEPDALPVFAERAMARFSALGGIGAGVAEDTPSSAALPPVGSGAR